MAESVKDIYATGNYLNAATVKEDKLKGKTLTITEINEATLQDKTKLVLSFEEIANTLVLNPTNAKIIAEAYGDLFKEWVGKTIKLGLTKFNIEGQLKDSIQVNIEGD